MLIESLFILFFVAESHAARGTVQTFSPCPTQVFLVTQLDGGPPGKSGNWEGTIFLDRFVGRFPLRIVLTFNDENRLTLEDSYGSLAYENYAYEISYDNPPPQNRINFSVRQGPHSTPLYPTGIYLNGKDICNSGTQPEIVTTNRPTTRRTTRYPTPTRPNSDNRVDITDDLGNLACGKQKVTHQGFITHGYSTKEGDWPWHTAIFHRENRDSYTYKCGGSLISHKIVITAAHCVTENGSPIISERVLVKLGLYNRLVSSRNTQEHEVYSVIVHKAFDSNDLKNDIALLKLATQVVFTNYIQPVCLWPRNQIDFRNVLNKEGRVVGWGLNADDQLTDTLSEAKMPVVDFQTCLASNRDFFGLFLSNENYCAGFRNGTGVCNGDSGGGMTFLMNGRYHLRGLVSLSVSLDNKNVCNPKQFVLFTDVAKYLDWINRYAT